jgi:signal transduction histidine kinase
VINVLANAQRHTPDGTRITLSGTLTPSDVGFTVTDTGPGIAPAELDAIFRRFHRLASEVEGSGLGLAIARRIVDLHGGRMWVESVPNEGASFHVTFARPATGALA